MRIQGCDARKIFFRASNPPRHPPPRWIVVRCTRNINKDGARFGVRVRLWRSYGKREDCKQSEGEVVRTPWTLLLDPLLQQVYNLLFLFSSFIYIYVSFVSCLPRTMGEICGVTCALFSCSHGGTCIIQDGQFSCK